MRVARRALPAGGFSYWQETRFPARTVVLKGLPVQLRVQTVERRELRAIKQAAPRRPLHAKRVGSSIRRSVEARVAGKNGCRPFQSPSNDSIGEADDHCVATGNSFTGDGSEDDGRPVAVSASMVHVFQAELGCLPDSGQFRFRWLVEGMAEEVAWRALIRAGRSSNRHVEETIRADALPDHGLVGAGLYPLAAYEWADGADREYALWHLAVRHLLRAAVEDGAAPRERPEVSLRRFCERVGAGIRWKSRSHVAWAARRRFTASSRGPGRADS